LWPAIAVLWSPGRYKIARDASDLIDSSMTCCRRWPIRGPKKKKGASIRALPAVHPDGLTTSPSKIAFNYHQDGGDWTKPFADAEVNRQHRSPAIG